MSEFVQRPEYLEDLIRLREKDVIKVVTGIRRCGKSTLFDLYCEYLIEDGVLPEQIIRINLEAPEYFDVDDYKTLYYLVKDQLNEDKMNYIFLDEVQVVTGFERAVDSLHLQKNCDVYVTGSNAYLLSGELATFLAGRYIEIKMMPFSFKEYVSAQGEQVDLMLKYQNYIRNSSFPYTIHLKERKDIDAYLDGIYNSIVLKDIVARYQIQDIHILERLIRYMFDNVGNLCSATKIANTLISSGRKVSVQTVERYLESLVNSFILYKVNRYDVKGKQHLITGYKYYLCDIGLRYYLLGTKFVDMGHVLENIIYLELLRRGYQVYIGKVNALEVDFVANGAEGMEYYQVAYTVMGEEGKTLERELKPLNQITDHNPKYLLTMDMVPMVLHNGIKQMNALEWLLK